MLLPSDRLTPDDLAYWREIEAADRSNVRVRGSRIRSLVDRSMDEITKFTASKDCYAGVSWGKDSVVMAHLIWRTMAVTKVVVPLVWVRVEPIANPDCGMVRDVFRERFYCDYSEIVVHCDRGVFDWHASGTLEAGFQEAERRFGTRHVSGVRGEESGARAVRMRRWGPTTGKTLAPLIYWTTDDIFAYMNAYNLPIHPAYAMTAGGRWDRKHLRVASLGGQRGVQYGRREWEREYYGDVLRRLEAGG